MGHIKVHKILIIPKELITLIASITKDDIFISQTFRNSMPHGSKGLRQHPKMRELVS
ncbi:hypothetical protein ACT3TH_09875 [Psychrobacter sp. AOP22-C1-C5]|uniref:hypothetical protein n=1 Tax=Psychrobacter sp. AOP22-C1-C5 TaxID=3457716 RepID=UPI0040361472